MISSLEINNRKTSNSNQAIKFPKNKDAPPFMINFNFLWKVPHEVIKIDQNNDESKCCKYEVIIENVKRKHKFAQIKKGFVHKHNRSTNGTTPNQCRIDGIRVEFLRSEYK